jgi:outer membrane cobalamin receptor
VTNSDTKTAIWTVILVAVALGFLVFPQAASAAEPETSSDAGASPVFEPTTSPETSDNKSTDATNPTGEATTTVVIGKRLPPPGTISQIDAKEISLRGARNVPEALALEPSIEVQQSPKQGATLQIRGFEEREILIMMEGIPVHEVYDGHFDIVSLPVFSLGSIDLERGVTSLLYGPNSMAGILALHAPTTCDDLVDVSAFGGRLHSGQLMLYGGRLKACKKISDFTFHVSTGYEHSDGYVLSNTYTQNTNNAQYHEEGGVRDGSDYERATVALLAKYAPRKNKNISLFFDYIHSPRGIPTHEGNKVVRYWRFKNYETLLVGVSGSYGPEPDKLPIAWGFRELKGQIYTNVFRDELYDYEDATYERLTTNPKAWFAASAYANETYGAAIQNAWTLNSGNRLDISLRYNLDTHREHDLPVPSNGEATSWKPWNHYSAHIFNFAVEDTQVLGSWKLNAGFGWSGMSLIDMEVDKEDQPVDKSVIPAYEGRLVVEKTLGEGFRLMAAAGHKVRFPTLKERFSEHAGGNRKLQAEKALMTEAGFDSKGIPIDGLDTMARIFFNSIQDLIAKNSDSIFVNVGRAVTAGVEIEFKHKPVDYLQLFSGYRYLYAHDVNNDHPLDYRTPQRIALGARLFTKIGFTFALEAIYNSGQESYSFDSDKKKWVAKESLPSYVLVNGHIRYEQAGSDLIKLYLFLDVFNLFDVNYYVGSFDPRPGRELIIGLGGRI